MKSEIKKWLSSKSGNLEERIKVLTDKLACSDAMLDGEQKGIHHALPTTASVSGSDFEFPGSGLGGEFPRVGWGGASRSAQLSGAVLEEWNGGKVHDELLDAMDLHCNIRFHHSRMKWG